MYTLIIFQYSNLNFQRKRTFGMKNEIFNKSKTKKKCIIREAIYINLLGFFETYQNT